MCRAVFGQFLELSEGFQFFPMLFCEINMTAVGHQPVKV